MVSATELFNSNDEYKCTLSPELQKLAQEELREDENTRTQAIQQVRDWINKHPNIKKCRTDSIFLLRFLRTKKFSVPLTCEMIERYLTIRQLFPDWFTKLDIEDKDIADIIDNGYLVPLPKRDDDGRQVLLSCAGKFDPFKHSSSHMVRVHSLVMEALMDDEVNQIKGYTYINDESGLQMGHISLWSLKDVRNIMKCVQKSSPMRHKNSHFINIPQYAVKIFEFAISLLSDKLKSRIHLDKSIDELKAKVNPKILPEEYGGEGGSLKSMIEDCKKLLREKRDVILALDEMQIDINFKDNPLVSEMNEELGIGVEGSFRKLLVD
ncbi:clavesin-1 [Chrysoperla carnea]|uniref:clavesin-1 n=1 Tax=Chrysoperla carnea TaxID=189513 RepID=UPI001D0863D7|nr:clavesin-1 [Chrysoperla carnea]